MTPRAFPLSSGNRTRADPATPPDLDRLVRAHTTAPPVDLPGILTGAFDAADARFDEIVTLNVA